MLRRIAWFFTALCIAGCFLTLVAIVLLNVADVVHYVHRSPDGTNVGIYNTSGGDLLIRSRGFGPDIDSDTTLSPAVIAFLFSLPPALWYLAHRVIPPGQRRKTSFKAFCAACPILLLVVLDVQSFRVPFFSITILIMYGISLASRSPTSLADRRRQRGLCAQCGYDLRATPDATGPRLPRCPECGLSTPSQAKTPTFS